MGVFGLIVFLEFCQEFFLTLLVPFYIHYSLCAMLKETAAKATLQRSLRDLPFFMLMDEVSKVQTWSMIRNFFCIVTQWAV